MNTKSVKANLTAPVPIKTLPPAPPNPEALKARCFDPNWRFVKPEATDIRKTFARVLRQQKEAEAAKREAEATHGPHIVAPIKRKVA